MPDNERENPAITASAAYSRFFPPPGTGDLLLICPPFHDLERPSLGLHIIKSIAKAQAMEAHVLYANLGFAALIGEADYLAVSGTPTLSLIGERIFAPAAFPGHPFPPYADFTSNPLSESELATLQRVEDAAAAWLGAFRIYVRESDHALYGISTMFCQNLATACMARIIGEEKPGARILIGGANCDGELAQGMLLLCPDASHVFSGESEASFADFCRSYRDGSLDRIPKIVRGSPNEDWKALPVADMSAYFSQLEMLLPSSELLARQQYVIPYESSRGCWWGQKSHCTFCGLNAMGMAFRAREADQVLADLTTIAQTYPARRISMTDNIMPFPYFKTLLPALARAKLGLDIFYEQKSNLKRSQLVALRDAGVNSIQPGIESLSTPALKRMRKGVRAAQNLAVLRDTTSLGIHVSWNLLYGLPGEEDADYEHMLSILPLLVHLQPPGACSAVSFDRFSPYHDEPAAFGLSNLRPHPNYARIYPTPLDRESMLAYHFVADAQTIASRDSAVFAKMRSTVDAWQAKWTETTRPVLCVIQSKQGAYAVVDTRFQEKPRITPVARDLALAITSSATGSGTVPGMDRARAEGWLVDLDGHRVGLAAATCMDLFHALPENENALPVLA